MLISIEEARNYLIQLKQLLVLLTLVLLLARLVYLVETIKQEVAAVALVVVHHLQLQATNKILKYQVYLKLL
jgi:hypothetical protein